MRKCNGPVRTCRRRESPRGIRSGLARRKCEPTHRPSGTAGHRFSNAANSSFFAILVAVVSGAEHLRILNFGVTACPLGLAVISLQKPSVLAGSACGRVHVLAAGLLFEYDFSRLLPECAWFFLRVGSGALALGPLVHVFRLGLLF